LARRNTGCEFADRAEQKGLESLGHGPFNLKSGGSTTCSPS
jgi:hypothetical protein